MRLLTELPRQRTPWQARLLAFAIGVLGPVALALTVGQAARQAPHDAATPSERVVAVDLPWVPTTHPVDEGTSSARPATAVAPAAPARDLAASGVMGVPGTAPRDSSGARVSDAARPDAAAALPRVPGAREVFKSPTEVRPLCLPPCGATGPAVVAGVGGRAGASVLFPPMSRQERDSISRAVILAAAAAGGASGHAATHLPPGVAAVSIPVGLPGGGPTRAQRERARVLDADVSGRLARIRARADSLAELAHRDSVARAQPRGQETQANGGAPDAS